VFLRMLKQILPCVSVNMVPSPAVKCGRTHPTSPRTQDLVMTSPLQNPSQIWLLQHYASVWQGVILSDRGRNLGPEVTIPFQPPP